MEDGDVIQKESLTLPRGPRRSEPSCPRPLKDLTSSEKDLLLEALEVSDWVQKDAASRLGITARKLNYMVKKHGITHARWRKNR